MIIRSPTMDQPIKMPPTPPRGPASIAVAMLVHLSRAAAAVDNP